MSTSPVSRLQALPCCFIPNRGQLNNPHVLFTTKGARFEASFTTGEAIFTIYGQSESSPSEREVRQTRLDFRFLDADPGVQPEGEQATEGKHHYFRGADPSQWRTNIPAYQRIVYRELWRGVDLIFRGEGQAIKYEFIVHPGADASQIRFAYEGAEQVVHDEEGSLNIHTSLGILTDPAPICYQEMNGQRIAVASSFLLESTGQSAYAVGFLLDEPYDTQVPLVIDPGLVYSTFLGGSGNDEPFGIAADLAGNVYVTGITTSTDFPVTPGALQSVNAGDRDAFITKLNTTGTGLIYSTYLGGTAYDVGQNIKIDAAGIAYVTGRTYSDNFPVTPGAAQPTFGGVSDGFVVKLSAEGNELLYSTYLGGNAHDYGLGIAIDSTGNAYVTGFTASPDFPVTAGSYQATYGGANDGFVTKLSPSGDFVYSTYLGGSSGDNGTAIAVDSSGNAYVTGNTNSTNFPTTPGAFQTVRRGTGDTFVTKLNAAGDALMYSTYFGGSSVDYSYGIETDAAGNAYVAGYTRSTDFPVTAGAFQATLGGTADVFAAKFNSAGNGLIYSTYIGRSSTQLAYGSGLDTGGNAFVGGYTLATDYPTTPDALQTTLNGTRDAIISKINDTGSGLIFSSYLGGSGVDSASAIAGDVLGNMYITGYTFSEDFPVTPGAFQTTQAGLVDVFVTKFGLVPYMTVDKSVSQTDVVPGDAVTYYITVTNSGETELTSIHVEDGLIGLSTTIPSLAVGASQTIMQTFTVPSTTPPGIITNTVTATAAELSQGREATTVINVGSVPVLTFTKTVAPAEAAPGDTVMFTITAANNGNVEFTNVTLTDLLLELNESIERIGIGVQDIFTVPFTIPLNTPSGTAIVNTAEIQGNNLPLRQATAAVLVLSTPQLELTKTADRVSTPPGGTVNFTITVHNKGSVALTNVAVADHFLAVDQTIPSLAAGQSMTIPVSFLVPLELPPAIYTNTAEAVSALTTRITATASVEVLAAPLLGVRKLPDTNIAVPGQTINYSITVANPGNVVLTGVRVLDPLLGIDMAIPDLMIGESHELTLPFTIPAGAPVDSMIANLLTVTSNETPPSEALSVVTIIAQGLRLTKTADTNSAAPGAGVSFTLTITNLLSTPQTNVTINDPLLGINEVVALLPAGGTIIRTEPFIIPIGAANGSVITNTFEAGSDQTPVQSASASIVVQQLPIPTTSITLNKRSDRNAAAPNETVIFTVEVANTGSNPAADIVLTDSLTGAQATIATLLPGQITYVSFPFTIPADASQGTVFANRVTAVWPEQPAGSPTPYSDALVVVGLQRFLLDLTNTAVPTLADPGSRVIFNVTVTNNSSQVLTNVRVIEPLTDFSTLIPSLNPGHSQLFPLPFTIPSDAAGGEVFTSHAVAFSEQTPIQQAPAPVTTARIAAAVLTETVDPSEGRPGETVFFSIRVRNTGNVVLLNGVLSAPLFRLQLRGDAFDIGADYTLRIPFVLPEADEDTTIVSPVTSSWSNGPSLSATASVRVIVDEE